MAMGTNEQGFLTGAASGAAAGGMAFGPWGAAAGAIIGGALGYAQADKQRGIQKQAVKDAERARRDSIVRELGAKQQADAVALAGLTSKGGTPVSGNNAGSTPGAVGMIGAGISQTSSGTF